jgi:photosystem II stability/assembly factor-like uncharacterized protein
MSPKPGQPATDRRGTAPRWRDRRSLALVAVAAGSILMGAAPAAAAPGRWVPLGPFGAPVVSLAVTAEAPQVLFAGTTNGLFKSAVAGSTALRFEALPLDRYITALVVVPSDPPAVLAATGSGIFRSADGGSTWQSIPVEAGGHQLFAVEFQTLAVDPRDPTIVYAGAGLTGDGGADSGLFKSADAGLTFEAADLGIESTVVSSIAVDPFHPRTVYAASPQPSNLVSTPQPTGVFKSTDGGATWQVKDQGLRLPADERFGIQAGVIQVAADPEAAGTLYAVVGSSGELYRSRDGAESWQLLPASPAATTLVVGRHGVLYLGGAPPGQPPAVWKSLDGGRHWRRTAAPISTALLAPALEPAAGRGGVSSDVLYAATDGGMARSTDGGASWQVSDAGMSLLAIDRLAVSSGTVYVVAGADLYRGNFFGSAWRLVLPQANATPPFTITDLAVNPEDPSRLFAAVDGRLVSSVTAGRRWRDVALPDATCNQLTSVAVAPSDGLTVYAGGSPTSGIDDSPPPCSGGCQMFRSRDGGVTWECLPLVNVTGLVVDPSDPETVYAFQPVLPGVALDCDVAKSSDGGRTWQPLRPGDLGFGAGFRILAIDPATPRHLDTVLDRTLWESLDGGQSWATKGTGFPSSPAGFPVFVPALLFDPRDSSVLYASVDPVGVVRSTNGGLTWTLLGGGLPPGVIDAAGPLTIDPRRADLLFLGTGNRGVYRLQQ